MDRQSGKRAARRLERYLLLSLVTLVAAALGLLAIAATTLARGNVWGLLLLPAANIVSVYAVRMKGRLAKVRSYGHSAVLERTQNKGVR